MYIYMTILPYSDSYHKVYLRITYMVLYLIYYMHIRKREREKGRHKNVQQWKLNVKSIQLTASAFHFITS